MSNKVAVNIRTAKQQDKLFKAYDEMGWNTGLIKEGMCLPSVFEMYGKDICVEFQNDNYACDIDFYKDNNYEIITVTEALRRLKKMKKEIKIEVEETEEEGVFKLVNPLSRKEFKKITGRHLFKVGDRVQIKEWDEMVEEFGTHWHGTCSSDLNFCESMKHLCGRTARIKEFNEECIFLNGWSNEDGDLYWTFSTDMIKPVEEHKPKIITLDENTNVEGRFKLVSTINSINDQFIGEIFTYVVYHDRKNAHCDALGKGNILLPYGATFEVLEEEPKEDNLFRCNDAGKVASFGRTVQEEEDAWIHLNKEDTTVKEDFSIKFREDGKEGILLNGKDVYPDTHKRISQAMLVLHDVEITEQNIGRVEALINHLNN